MSEPSKTLEENARQDLNAAVGEMLGWMESQSLPLNHPARSALRRIMMALVFLAPKSLDLDIKTRISKEGKP